MVIAFGGFRFEVRGLTLFVRVPLVGQAFLGGGLSAYDSWRTLRRLGGV